MSLIPLITFWMVWKERNMRVFKGVEDDFDRLEVDGFRSLVFY